MTTLDKQTINGDWTLIYDASLSGDFTGAAWSVTGDQVIYRVASDVPASDSGLLSGGGIGVTMLAARSDKLYARAYDGHAVVVLDYSTMNGGFPAGVFEGLRAITTQPYTEANVKNGTQFYIRAAWPLSDTISSGSERLVYFATGAEKVTVKLREFSYIAEELYIKLWQGPTGVTGGTDLDINNYNSVNPNETIADDIVAKKNVTVTTKGTEFGGSDPEYYFGANSVGNRVQSSIPEGRERILPPNTEFIVEIGNTGSGAARAQYFIDFYVGELDLPLVKE